MRIAVMYKKEICGKMMDCLYKYVLMTSYPTAERAEQALKETIAEAKAETNSTVWTEIDE